MRHLVEKINITRFKYKRKKRVKVSPIRLIDEKQEFKVEQKKPKYFIYIITTDGGLAPNPFHKFCTLAVCKPEIRKIAKEGDWIIGLYSQAKNKIKNYRGKLIYAMKVEEKITFSQYWKDKRFLRKKQNTKSTKGRCGDNMYYKTSDGYWVQKTYEAHNSSGNRKTDTSVDAVLISKHFFYLGKKCVSFPRCIKGSTNKSWQQRGSKVSIDRLGRKHRYLDREHGKMLIEWLEKICIKKGRHGDPISYEEEKNKCGTKIC